jgi:signal transduction histidine kinase/ActR/RegA family two-component response regulator
LRPVTRSGESFLVESFWSLVRDEFGWPKKVLIIEADITQKRKLENQIAESQRLETLGMLAGGIAHDLNNMLAPILMATETLMANAAIPAQREMLEVLGVSARHGVEMVRQLLSFSRGESEQRAEAEVSALIGSVERLLLGAMPTEIDLKVSVPSGLWLIHADATQIRQILLNLCLNARDAISGAGMINISAANVEVPQGIKCIRGEPAEAGRYVRLSVSDTGSGIPPHLLDKIFDRFFTTKEAGKGTGLGLVNVAEIVRSHLGFMTLETEVGVGSAFHVHLPVTEIRLRSGVVVPGAVTLRGKGERILLIDDDEEVGATLELILNTRGYTVTVVDCGKAGIKILAENPGRYQLVITDLHLSGMSGMDVVEYARSLARPPRIMVMSGLLRELPMASEPSSEITFVEKPIGVDDLAAAVRAALDGSGNDSVGAAPAQSDFPAGRNAA